MFLLIAIKAIGEDLLILKGDLSAVGVNYLLITFCVSAISGCRLDGLHTDTYVS